MQQLSAGCGWLPRYLLIACLLALTDGDCSKVGQYNSETLQLCNTSL